MNIQRHELLQSQIYCFVILALASLLRLIVYRSVCSTAHPRPFSNPSVPKRTGRAQQSLLCVCRAVPAASGRVGETVITRGVIESGGINPTRHTRHTRLGRSTHSLPRCRVDRHCNRRVSLTQNVIRQTHYPSSSGRFVTSISEI
jgi:hypothetical protein